MEINQELNKRWTALMSYSRLRKSEKDDFRNKAEGDARTPIESDFGRAIFSEACRRLHDKTQVFPLTSNDNIHSRLTHSMEVMNIGLSFALFLSQKKDFLEHIGKNVGENYVLRDINSVLKTTCLVHDIGNPPFGHFGEDVIQECFKELFASLSDEINAKQRGLILEFKHPILKSAYLLGVDSDKYLQHLNDFLSEESCSKFDYTQFDGNAQGFRILTKLQYQGDLYGLNLTYATLAASLKYPNTGTKMKDECKVCDRIALHKHGVFTTERDYLKKIAETCNLVNEDNSIKRHPLSFLMEASDSICYLIMDIEDALSKNWIKLDDVLEEINKETSEEFKEKIKVQEFSRTSSCLRKRIISFRNFLFDYLISKAVTNFINNIDKIEDGVYQNELIFDDEAKVAECLISFCHKNILSQREILSLEVTGRAVISGLFKIYINLLFHNERGFRDRGKFLISKAIFKTTLHEHCKSIGMKYCDIDALYQKFDVKDFTVEERLRIIRDFIAGMTDKFALNHFRKLSGQQIS